MRPMVQSLALCRKKKSKIKTLGWRDGSVGEYLLGKHEDLSFVVVMQARGRDRRREAGPGGLMYSESMTELRGRACLTDTWIGL